MANDKILGRLAACAIVVLISLYALWLLVWHATKPRGSLAEQILAAYDPGREYSGVNFIYPLDGSVFPPDLMPPTVRWRDRHPAANCWLLTIAFSDGGSRLDCLSPAPQWTPSDDQWAMIRQRTRGVPARLSVLGVRREDPGQILAGGSISFSTSQDPVAAPLFFREVNVPFLEAVKDPAAHIRWRFGPVSSKGPPPIVLEKLPVCGNCHSFSADGTTLAMEVDSGNDKGSYAVLPLAEQMLLDHTRLISWSDYRREDEELTFGLLCQVSPDGRFVVGTVKDRALAVYKPDLAFSQLFFLVKGILAIYDREKKTFTALPGADDREYVQTNGTWSPDGKTIVFARSRDKAYDPPGLRGIDTVVVPRKEADAFLEGGRIFQYDLYRIPFNDGKGGKAEPIAGASNNGMSNYFPKFSPDGKWIVFCKARSFMLLQPDSELYIIPAQGGEARRLRCNTQRMNSWHSWSPNGKWLVFSSKAYSDYTQLFLTHIDEHGESTPPVLLEDFTEPNRAANIPEFVNAPARAIKRIAFSFLDDRSYVRTGYQKFLQGDFAGAAADYRRAAEHNSANSEAWLYLGLCCVARSQVREAEACFEKVLQLMPDGAGDLYARAVRLAREQRADEALILCRLALRLRPGYFEAIQALGMIQLERGKWREAKTELAAALRLRPNDPSALYYYGRAVQEEGDIALAADHFERALLGDPDLVEALMSLALIRATARAAELRDVEGAVRHAQRACRLTANRNPVALDILAVAFAEAGRFADAIQAATRALHAAHAGGAAHLVPVLEQRIALFQQRQARAATSASSPP